MNPIDISEVIIYHLSWKLKIRDFLNGEGDLTEAQVVSHKECDLGKWLNSETMEQKHSIPEIQELKQVHVDLHRTMKRIFQMKYSGDISQAEEGMVEMELLSQKIFSLLLSIKHSNVLY